MAEANISTRKTCTKCKVEDDLSSFNKDKTRTDGLFPWCRTCIKANNKTKYIANKEAYNLARKLDYQKKKDAYKANAKRWAEENPEKRKEIRLKYARANKEKKRIDNKKHRDENPGLYRAHFKKRQQLKRNAMPAWANEAAIRLIYDECSRISKETGVKHHVDHYYPLKNDLVCGLHNEFNLRIITAFDNLSKGNSYPTEE